MGIEAGGETEGSAEEWSEGGSAGRDDSDVELEAWFGQREDVVRRWG
jgi:hypothetical protein